MTTIVAGNGTDLIDNGKLNIQSEGIRASFIAYGARITNLFVMDSDGVERDIVMGYDSPSQYTSARPNETFGGVHGRYIYSLSNASLPLDPSQDLSWTFANSSAGSHNSTDRDMSDWIFRNWTIVAHTSTSVTFQLIDFDPVNRDQTITFVTYTVTQRQLSTRIDAVSTTSFVPLMPFSRTFWNLDGAFSGDTASVLNHTLLLPYSGQRIDVNAVSRLPTGLVDENSLYSAYDFWHASKALGRNFTSQRHGPTYCADPGSDCTGYDTTFLVNRDAMQGRYDWTRDPAARLQSAASGLRMYLFTDQAALHLATCNRFGQGANVALKSTQGKGLVRQHACVALAPHDWPAGLAHPGWGRNARQASGPADAPYVWQAAYSFATVAARTTTCLSRETAATATVTVTATVTTDGASLFG